MSYEHEWRLLQAHLRSGRTLERYIEENYDPDYHHWREHLMVRVEEPGKEPFLGLVQGAVEEDNPHHIGGSPTDPLNRIATHLLVRPRFDPSHLMSDIRPDGEPVPIEYCTPVRWA